MNINCLIIDDEPSSQTVLKTFVDRVDFLQLVAICNNAVEALSKLQSDNTIDLIFLDINMPKISGVSFYKSLVDPPMVIFTTAYPEYAIEGFDVNAIDYLLKPFSFDRFFKAVNKAVDRIKSKSASNPSNEHILIKADKKLYRIEISSILFIQAYGDYVKIHKEDGFLLTNNTFKKILDLLPKKKFMQIHKSFAINLEKVSIIDGNQVLINDSKIPMGLKYKSLFLEKFKKE